jgi:hypothetical protein
MLRACKTVCACKRRRALLGRRGGVATYVIEEQQRRAARKMCNRVRSVLTQLVNVIKAKMPRTCNTLIQAISGQSPFLGLISATVWFLEAGRNVQRAGLQLGSRSNTSNGFLGGYRIMIVNGPQFACASSHRRVAPWTGRVTYPPIAIFHPDCACPVASRRSQR